MFSRQRPLNLFHVTSKLLKVRPILTKLAPISLQPSLYFENNKIPINTGFVMYEPATLCGLQNLE